MVKMTLRKAIFSKAGHTILEVLMSSVVLALITAAVITGLILFGRSERAITSQVRVTESARRFMQTLATDLSDSTGVEIDVSDSVDELRIVRVDAPDIHYRYIDWDNNPDTIEDNEIVTWVDPNSPSNRANTTEALSMCSKIPNQQVFTMLQQVPAELISVRVRVGDRERDFSGGTSRTMTLADNRITGRGYQSFVLEQSVSRVEPYNN
jgi:type II secretory pathway pseudopilin PulG